MTLSERAVESAIKRQMGGDTKVAFGDGLVYFLPPAADAVSYYELSDEAKKFLARLDEGQPVETPIELLLPPSVSDDERRRN